MVSRYPVNTELHEMMRSHAIYYWQVADKIGVSESTLIRWFRKDLNPDKNKIVRAAIDSILGERGNVEK